MRTSKKNQTPCNLQGVFFVTLYNGDVRKTISTVCKVLAIFSKAYNDGKYNECTYLSKGQQLGKLKLDELSRKSLDEKLLANHK